MAHVRNGCNMLTRVNAMKTYCKTDSKLDEGKNACKLGKNLQNTFVLYNLKRTTKMF